MDAELVLGIDPADIPAADERDDWDEEREPTEEEPPDLYHTGDPGTPSSDELYDVDGVRYEQDPLLDAE
jgi:hypothetical protein